MHKIERRECLILAFPVQRRLIAELPVWHNVHMRFSSHAKVRRENEQVPAHQNRRSTRKDSQRGEAAGVGERVSKGYLSLVVVATFLGKFSCQFEQCFGFVEITAG